jgi:hypothetical protein
LATQMSHLSRPPRGQQRDKPYREALRMELAAAGANMKKLREIARAHIARCEAGDMQAIKDLADRLDGRPAQIPEQNDSDSAPILKIVREFVHVTATPEEIAAEGEEPLIDGNGTGNEDDARTKR